MFSCWRPDFIYIVCFLIMRSYKNTFKIKDELYTPKKLVDIILPYLNKDKIIWCPFDTDSSEFVLSLKENNFKVEYSHIINGKDFFKYEPDKWDIAVSNPPFSVKKEVFERLFSLKKPFAMIMNIMAINYQEIGNLFYNNPIQLLIPDKKVSFDGNQSSFCSGYVCKDLLPKDLIFCHLKDNNTGKNFVKSRMHL